MRKLRIHRRAHPRRSFTKRSGTRISRTHVRATTFDIEDSGAPRRGPQVIKITKPRRAYQLTREQVDEENAYGYAPSKKEFIKSMPKLTRQMVRRGLIKVKSLGKIAE